MIAPCSFEWQSPFRRKAGRAEAPKNNGYLVSPMAIFNTAQRDGTTVNNKPFDTFMQWGSRLSVLMALPMLLSTVDTPEVCGCYFVPLQSTSGDLFELVEKLQVFMGKDEDPSWHRVNLC
jgi:hypothetical protein